MTIPICSNIYVEVFHKLDVDIPNKWNNISLLTM